MKHFKGLHYQFTKFDTEFDACSLLKFEVHSRVAKKKNQYSYTNRLIVDTKIGIILDTYLQQYR